MPKCVDVLVSLLRERRPTERVGGRVALDGSRVDRARATVVPLTDPFLFLFPSDTQREKALAPYFPLELPFDFCLRESARAF